MARLLALVLMLIIATPAGAVRITCAPRENLLRFLSINYQEAPLLTLVSADGHTLEVVASEKGTWTLLRTIPGQLPCVIDAGHWVAPKVAAVGGVLH
jgi:hypothetical protein